MYITGIGKTKFGPSNKTIGQLAYEAIYKAIEDSHLSINDIDAIMIGNFLAGPLQNQLHLNSLISSFLPGLNIPIVRVEASCASGGVAFYQGLMTLANYNNVLVVGVEKMSEIEVTEISHRIASAGDVYLDQKQGVIFPACYALIAEEYMKKYEMTGEDFSLISFRAHQNANLNPLAHFYHKKVSMEDIKNSPMVCSPFQLFNCSPISDGAAAVIISKEKKSERDVEILSSVLKTDSISICQRQETTSFAATRKAAQEAYEKAKVGPEDIDVVEVHDGFTIAEVVAIEDLGFCKPGEYKYLVREGKTNISGSLPINPSGGLKANGHPIGATGISQIYEIVTQLRDEAGTRQVKDAKIGLAQNIGGVGGTAVVTILKK